MGEGAQQKLSQQKYRCFFFNIFVCFSICHKNNQEELINRNSDRTVPTSAVTRLRCFPAQAGSGAWFQTGSCHEDAKGVPIPTCP